MEKLEDVIRFFKEYRYSKNVYLVIALGKRIKVYGKQS